MKTFLITRFLQDTRPFLDLRNFHNPMKGMMQTLVQRAISSGMYFPLEDIFKSSIQARWGTSDEYRSLQNFAAGTLAGMLNGIIMNPSSSIKVISLYISLETSFYSFIYIT